MHIDTVITKAYYKEKFKNYLIATFYANELIRKNYVNT